MANAYETLSDLLVEWVYDRSNTPLGDVEFAEFSQLHGLNREDSYGLLRHCKERGLLDDRHSDHDAPVANMTAGGIAWVKQRRERRNNPILRTASARRGLLIWLWSAKHNGAHSLNVDQFLEAEQSIYEGERLQVDEVDRAAEYLDTKGLITGVRAAGRRGPIRAETTSHGDDCVERFGGDVSEYERHSTAGGTVVNIGGNNSGNIATNSHDVTMNASTINNGLTDVVTFARAIHDALPTLTLPDGEANELAELADRIEQEASAEAPDRSRIARWMGSTIALLNSPVVSGVLAGVLAAYGGIVLPGLTGS